LRKSIASVQQEQDAGNGGDRDSRDCQFGQLRQLSTLLQAGGAAALSREAHEASEANDALRSELARLTRECRDARSYLERAGTGDRFETGTQTEAKQLSCVGSSCPTTGRRSTTARSPACSLPGMPAIIDGANFQSSPTCARSSVVAEATSDAASALAPSGDDGRHSSGIEGEIDGQV